MVNYNAPLGTMHRALCTISALDTPSIFQKEFGQESIPVIFTAV